MSQLIVFIFAIATGVTLSGLVANTYRLFAGSPETIAGKIIEAAVMIFGGPIVLIGNSTKAFMKKDCSRGGYALALALGGFWSFATGVFILAIYVSLKA
jgi:hypothetical protein